MIDHDVRVEYSINDDGIWLACSCGWERKAGFRPAPMSLVLISSGHLAEVELAAQLSTAEDRS